MTAAPPLRFVGVVLGGWIAARAALLAPFWSEDVGEPRLSGPPPELLSEPRSREVPANQADHQPRPASTPPFPSADAMMAPRESPRPVRMPALAPGNLAAFHMPAAPSPLAALLLPVLPVPQVEPVGPPVLTSGKRSPPAVGRWSVSAWAFVRRGSGTQLAAGGMLGGSQAGARIGYRIDGDPARPLALTARLYSPLHDRHGAEAAAGIEWRPLRSLPITLLAERRQAIGRNGRSAFGLTAYGGVSELRAYGPVVLDAYAQAGVVGMQSRDLFADGSASLSLPLDDSGELRLGAAAWGAAQPGVSRVDVGPRISWRLPVGGASVRATADWRFRVTGDAAPTSGPALTLSTSF